MTGRALAILVLIASSLVSIGRTADTTTLLIPQQVEQNITAQNSFSVLGVSVVDVVGSATEYVVSEVVTKNVIVQVKGTQTISNVLISTPTTATYTFEEGASFFRESIVVTAFGPDSTVFASGELSCTATSPETPGARVNCEEIISFSTLRSPQAFSFTAELTPAFTLVVPTSLPSSPSPTSTSDAHARYAPKLAGNFCITLALIMFLVGLLFS
ncbi:hypothetical protein CPB84DRAFT_957592 [Gymnopilus junonius]|uniref:Uncharacterized protein n=1 Tax=Gymnopilus junonius TaxID=109634 RepID=A0A9P5NRF7_GYMJU|nr:hypothetical protein CPB84DRAFT_957592 [Gymnopilus junonius]